MTARKKYYAEGGPLDDLDLPRHPRGIIGAMLANKLLSAGWTEVDHPTGTFWREPWQADGDAVTFLYTLEAANAVLDAGGKWGGPITVRIDAAGTGPAA